MFALVFAAVAAVAATQAFNVGTRAESHDDNTVDISGMMNVGIHGEQVRTMLVAWLCE